jgi:hypothetical protein
MEFLKFVDAFAFLFGFFYLVAAMGNDGTRRHQNNFGCAVIMFAAFIVYGLYKVLTGL